MNTTGRLGSRKKLRTVIDNMPVRGDNIRPVRLRVPSMKYSSGWPRAIMKPKYLVNTSA